MTCPGLVAGAPGAWLCPGHWLSGHLAHLAAGLRLVFVSFSGGSQEGRGGRLRAVVRVLFPSRVAIATVSTSVCVQCRSARRQGGCVLVAGPRRDQGGSHEEDLVWHQGAEPEPPSRRGLASALAACVLRASRD